MSGYLRRDSLRQTRWTRVETVRKGTGWHLLPSLILPVLDENSYALSIACLYRPQTLSNVDNFLRSAWADTNFDTAIEGEPMGGEQTKFTDLRLGVDRIFEHYSNF